jgi:hypothetical protein
MTETRFSTTQKILAFAAIAQFGTGIALMSAPAIVVTLRWRAEISDVATLLSRSFGIALIALGLACWPKRDRVEVGSTALRGMFAYNALIALFLGYVGAVVQLAGPLLWPAVALHGVVAVLLVWRRRVITVAVTLPVRSDGEQSQRELQLLGRVDSRPLIRGQEPHATRFDLINCADYFHSPFRHTCLSFRRIQDLANRPPHVAFDSA